MRLVIDATTCAGHGRCYAEAPQLVSADESGHGVVKHSEIPHELTDLAELVVNSCPEFAIHIERSQEDRGAH
ncbi:ferredoxin [Mycolicibacterium thermoresistibile]